MVSGFVGTGLVGCSVASASSAVCARQSTIFGAAVGAVRVTPGKGRQAARISMLSSNDMRPGVTVQIDGAVYKVIEFLHVKPGKGAAFVRTKLKNLETANTVEKTFRAGETIEQAVLDKSTMQHTYVEGDEYVFMNMETFEEERLQAETLGSNTKFMKEGLDVEVLRYEGKILDVELPKTMILEVSQTDPGVKGNTVQGGTKPATLETGAIIQVPLFIKTGEKIKVDVATAKYLQRAGKDEQ